MCLEGLMFEPRLNKRVGASQAKLEGVGDGKMENKGSEVQFRQSRVCQVNKYHI